MRHVVIKLNFVIHDGAQSDSEVAADYTIEGWNLMARLSGRDKHVEVEVHDLDVKEVANKSFSHAGETPPEGIVFDPIKAEQVVELMRRKVT